MGKIDEMRRLREKQFDAAKEGAPRVPPPAPAITPAHVPPLPGAYTQTRTRSPVDETGRCTGCGKVKPLANGLVSNHQKGLGKMCPGARKEPA